MAFFSGGNIDVVKLAELAAQELSMYAIAKQMGHSISGIRDCAERNNIVFTVCSKFKYINVDGVKMTTNDACESKGFKATSLYAWRVKRGLNEQDAYRKVLGERDERLKKDVWTVVHELYSPNKNEIPRKDFNSIKVFVEKLNLEDVVRAARKAVINKGEGSKFLFVYFCGICWRQIKEDNDEGTN